MRREPTQSRTRSPNGHNTTRRQPEISCTWAWGAEAVEGVLNTAFVAETIGRAKTESRVVPIDAVPAGRHLARMSAMLPPCPHLPVPRAGLDWRTLQRFRNERRGAEFYFACVEYAQVLWQRGLAARALLCLDRALGAELQGDESVLRDWPLPYAAMAWCIAHCPEGRFIGNPRVHFQHYAGRMNEPRREQRRWRAWACWALVRAVRPALSGDSHHPVEEPSLQKIEAQLATHGLPGEVDRWRAVLAGLVQNSS